MGQVSCHPTCATSWTDALSAVVISITMEFTFEILVLLDAWRAVTAQDARQAFPLADQVPDVTAQYRV
jgi:hypothetical protein